MADAKESEDEVPDRCIDCNYSFPSNKEGTTLVCLKDPEFEPFLDDILQGGSCDVCRELADRKKFPSEQSACADFEAAEAMEIDEKLAARLKKLADEGKLDGKSLEEAIIQARLESTDFAKLPLGTLEEDLKNAQNKKKRERAFRRLGALASLGNREAFRVLFEYLKNLPIPHAIEDVWYRVKVLRNLSHGGFNRELTDFLMDDLYRIPSNNTTRGWFKAVFDWLGRAPLDEIEDRLEKMLKEKRFSIRLKQKIKLILYPYC